MRNAVAAVIVTYNRKNDLLVNVTMLKLQTKQLDKIIIIDNCSTDGTEAFLAEKGLLEDPQIEYVRLSANTGGAGGFYEGTKRAYEMGYDYAWLMDDDGHPDHEQCFEAMMKWADILKEKNPLLMLNSLVIDHDKLSFGLMGCRTVEALHQKTSDEILYDYISPFNGTLVSRELISNIGFPNKEFFIKGDDVDYRLRAAEANAIVATIMASVYFHPALPSRYITILGRKLRISSESPWKEYYRARNHVYIELSHKRYGKLATHLLWQVKNVLLSGEDTGSKLKMFFRGIGDGFTGRLGQNVKPGDK